MPEKRYTSPDAFELLKRVSYLELLLECISEKKGIDFKNYLRKFTNT